MSYRCITELSCNILLLFSLSLHLHSEVDPKTVLVHYMPWYSSQSVSGGWGWHWTMNYFNPEKINEDGQRELASHDYPLIGPYDSNDGQTLECQVLLMKFSGIKGVIFDWYGIEDFRDYAMIHRNTKHMIKYIKKAELQFAICYEDQTVKHMIASKFLQKQEDHVHGKKVLQWLDKNWFSDDAYIKLDDQPMLLVFGPQYFEEKQWNYMVSGLSKRPRIYGLPHVFQQAEMSGVFGWPPVSGGKEIVPAVWKEYLGQLYIKELAAEAVIAVAFPGFHDIYNDVGLHESIGYIDDRAGKTFIETFEYAWNSQSKFIQIATWNDYGEGTGIEPTQSFKYQYLEEIQKYTQTGFGRDDLRLPVILYNLKKKHMKNSVVMEDLKQVSTLLFSSKCDEAITLLQPYIAKKTNK